MRGARIFSLLLVVAAASLGVLAHAAKPEDAPQESRDQVDVALKALAPALKKLGRPNAAKRGTIEAVISAYAPLKFHPVAEGTLSAAKPGAHCPSEMALIDERFCVDKHEGSLVERGGDGKETAYPHYLPPADGHVYFARSVAGIVPQAYISASQSQAACAASGKRLCHPVEWRVACGGSQAQAYPYGPTRVAGKCHDSGTAPMMVLFAATVNKGWGRTELNDPRLNQMQGTVAKTGEFSDCVSDLGVYDMVGNLHEWTADPNGTFQGGFWLDTAQHGDGCAYRTIAHEYTYHDYSTGFRCCADATP